jgi:phenylalanyl-tRNA synthetase beta chain
MNISRRWLEGFLRRPLEARDVAQRLVMLGAGVDAIEPLHPGLDPVVVGLVESVRPHPNADRLRLCVVNDGTAERLNVVCGAPNVTAGKRYPFARIGTRLPNGPTLERRKIRGEYSEGMLCSARELGLGQEHDGILELTTDAEPGTRLLDALPVDDDRLVVEVGPNRPDLLGHKGVARELANSYGVPFRLPTIPDAPADPLPAPRREAGPRVTIDRVVTGTDDVEGCPRFLSTVIRGVKVAPSPAWLADRLLAVGVRPINNVVDATNYVLLELNQPMHAYDLGRIQGPEIVARRAWAGEKLTTLDHVERTLTTEMTVIADRAGAVGIAGVMGAAHVEVSDATTDVFLECAWFEPRRIRRTRRALGLSTEASYRFERGIDRWGGPEALRRCVEIILTIAGGRVTAGAVDVWAEPSNPARIFVRLARVEQVLGVALPATAIEGHLLAIGCTVLQKPDDRRIAVDVPGWRPDLVEEIDLIEEIARLHGYDRFPTELRPYRVGPLGEEPLEAAAAGVRRGLALWGLRELQTLALGSKEGKGSVPLVNPMSAAEGYLRLNLLPGLTRAVQANWSRRERDIRLFEIGTVFRLSGPGERPLEERRVAAVVSGARVPPHWTTAGKSPDYDLWDLKALFQAAGALAIPDAIVQVDTAGWVALRNGSPVGQASRLELDTPPWAAPVFGLELLVDATPRKPPTILPLPTTPPAERDLALLLPPAVTSAQVVATIMRGVGSLLESVSVFDEYRTTDAADGRRSVAFHLVFRAADRTLRDAEVDALTSKATALLEKELDAKLRTA